MGSRLDLIQIVHGRWLELAALLVFPHSESLGKRIGLTLANSLMRYLSLIKQEEQKAMNRPHLFHPVGTTRSPRGCVGTQGSQTDRKSEPGQTTFAQVDRKVRRRITTHYED